MLREELPLAGSIQVLAEAVAEVGARSIRRSKRLDPTPLPLQPSHPPPEWVRLLTAPTDDRPRAHGAQAARRRTATARAPAGPARERRRADRRTGSRTFGPYDEIEPKVSVAVSLYNYEGYIREALASVAASDLNEIEVVLVDDASTDGSLRVAEEACAGLPWLAGKARSRVAPTTGSRPPGTSRSSTPARPTSSSSTPTTSSTRTRLGVWWNASTRSADAAFAYGILEKFDAGGPYDLVSWLPWDPERLRYGNFVDAMSLVRRSAFGDVGGYTTDVRLGGWEDLALWCAFAEAGLRGTLVPEIVARYRSGRHSMISVTNIDASEAWSVLLERFPVLRSG